MRVLLLFTQFFRHGSEPKLERQVDRARVADLVQRIEAAVRTPGAEAIAQRLCRVAELGTREVADWRAEDRIVEDVEELAAEATVNSLCEMKLALEGDIRL